MDKFTVGCLDHAGFSAIKDSLTEAFAETILAELEALGSDAKAISWFSSCAEEYYVNVVRLAA